VHPDEYALARFDPVPREQGYCGRNLKFGDNNGQVEQSRLSHSVVFGSRQG